MNLEQRRAQLWAECDRPPAEGTGGLRVLLKWIGKRGNAQISTSSWEILKEIERLLGAEQKPNGEVQMAMPVSKHSGVLTEASKPGEPVELFDNPQPCSCEHCTCAEPAEKGESCRACWGGFHFEKDAPMVNRKDDGAVDERV